MEQSAALAEEVTAVNEDQMVAVQSIVNLSKELGGLARELEQVTDSFKRK